MRKEKEALLEKIAQLERERKHLLHGAEDGAPFDPIALRASGASSHQPGLRSPALQQHSQDQDQDDQKQLLLLVEPEHSQGAAKVSMGPAQDNPSCKEAASAQPSEPCHQQQPGTRPTRQRATAGGKISKAHFGLGVTTRRQHVEALSGRRSHKGHGSSETLASLEPQTAQAPAINDGAAAPSKSKRHKVKSSSHAETRSPLASILPTRLPQNFR